MTAFHHPVMLREVMDALDIREGGVYADATEGLGGHTEEILKRVGVNGKVIGIDRDERALALVSARLSDERLLLRKGRFSELAGIVRSAGFEKVDGILFDLGVSMMQLKDEERGFSFHSKARLDMRMDPSGGLTAWDIVNSCPEKELSDILREYGEEWASARISRAIAAYRKARSIDTCEELAGIVAGVMGRRGRTHPATKTFQAIRIAVNMEMEELKRGLESALSVLGKGGRLCVISYHSLEDRVVKNFMRDNDRAGRLKSLSKKPVMPGLDETRANPPSRSAKLRGAEVP